MTFQKPGTYLIAVGCAGDGGGGSYSLSRDVLHAKEIAVGKLVNATASTGEVQIWEFTAKPDEPLYFHWKCSGWRFDVNVYDAEGNWTNFQRTQVDQQNQFGIIAVDRPQTFVIVVSGHGEPCPYTIQLSPLPDFAPTKVDVSKAKAGTKR